MPLDFDDVRPGDLITAKFMNRVLDTLEGLDDRLSEVEDQLDGKSDNVQIDEIKPTGPYEVEQEIRVEGKNFEYSLGALRVKIGNQRVNAFQPGTSDSKLVFNIPGIPGLRGETEVDLQVDNSSSSVSQTITVKPKPTPLEGSVDVVFDGVTPSTIESNEPATFEYTLTSDLNKQATLKLDPQFSSQAIDVNNWSPEVLDDGDNPLSNNELTLSPRETKTVQIRVPTITGSGDFSLELVVKADGTGYGTSGKKSFTIGSETVPPDNNIQPGSPELGQASLYASLSGSTLTLGEGGAARIRFPVTFTRAGTYNLSFALEDESSGWTVTINSNSPLEIVNSALGDDGQYRTSVTYDIRAEGSLSETSVTFRIQRQGANRFREMTLQLIPENA
jgi:hypothetical protein